MAVKNKKVAAGVGIAAVAAAALALGAGTFASFSATQAGPTGTVAAGTLQFGQPQPGSINVTQLSPGETSAPQTLSFLNGGTEPGKLTVTFPAITDVENGCNGDEQLFEPDQQTCSASATSGDLSPRLDVRITSGDVNGTLVYQGDVRALLPGANPAPSISPVTVAPAASQTYTFLFTFPEGGPSDNIAQGDRAVIETSARLDQAP